MKQKSRRNVTRHNTVTQPVKAETKVVTEEPKEELNEELILEFGESSVAIADIPRKVREHYQASGNDAAITDIKVYIKPEDNKAYYVINGEVNGAIDLV